MSHDTKNEPRSPDGTRILVVNPDSEFSNVLVENLRIVPGYEPHHVPGSVDALQLIKHERYDVVLSDQHLGEVTGLEFVHELRKEFISCPEIIILSNDPKLSIHEVHQVGACHVVKKPVNMEELCTAINRIAANNESRRRYDRVFINPTTMGRLFGHVAQHGKKTAYTVEVSNIGRGGFFYKVEKEDHLPQVGQVIDFNLTLGMVPDCHFSGRGIIRWVRKSGGEIGAGVEFLMIPEECEKLVMAFADLFKVQPFVPDN